MISRNAWRRAVRIMRNTTSPPQSYGWSISSSGMSFTQLLATRGHRKNLPAEVTHPDVPRLIAATDGFTGADLKRLVEDGKAIYVYDKARGAEQKPTNDYFMGAVEVVLSKSSPIRLRRADTCRDGASAR